MRNTQDIQIYSELNPEAHRQANVQCMLRVFLQKAYEVDTCAEFVYVRPCISAPKEMDGFLWNS